MYVVNQKTNPPYKKQVSDFHWGEGIGERQVCDRGLRYTNYYVQIGKKKYIVWCREL